MQVRYMFVRYECWYVKGEVKAKIKISPVVVFWVLSRMVLVRESWDAPFLLESQSNSRTSTETGWLHPTRWGFVCKMRLKAPFRSIKARMTAIGLYVVVFWTLSRLVLVRKGCDAAFLLYSQSNMVEQAVTCSWVPKSPGHHASRRQLSHQGSTRVTGVHPKKVKQLVETGVRRTTLLCYGARFVAA